MTVTKHVVQDTLWKYALTQDSFSFQVSVRNSDLGAVTTITLKQLSEVIELLNHDFRQHGPAKLSEELYEILMRHWRYLGSGFSDLDETDAGEPDNWRPLVATGVVLDCRTPEINFRMPLSEKEDSAICVNMEELPTGKLLAGIQDFAAGGLRMPKFTGTSIEYVPFPIQREVSYEVGCFHEELDGDDLVVQVDSFQEACLLLQHDFGSSGVEGLSPDLKTRIRNAWEYANEKRGDGEYRRWRDKDSVGMVADRVTLVSRGKPVSFSLELRGGTSKVTLDTSALQDQHRQALNAITALLLGHLKF